MKEKNTKNKKTKKQTDKERKIIWWKKNKDKKINK